MRLFRVIPALLLPAAVAVLLSGCGGDSDSSTNASGGGSPTSSDSWSDSCQDFANTDPADEEEFTYARGSEDAGVMGRLINDTDGMIWIRPRGHDKKVRMAENECVLESGQDVFFSRDQSYRFFMRPDEQPPDVQDSRYATALSVWESSSGPVWAQASWNMEQKTSWEKQLSEGESGLYEWEASRIEVTRERNGTYDSNFRSRDYLTSKMGDWPNFTIRVKGLIPWP